MKFPTTGNFTEMHVACNSYKVTVREKKQTLIALEQLIFLAKIFQIKITLWSFVCVFFYLMLESALQEEYLIPWYPLNKHFQTSKHSNNY